MASGRPLISVVLPVHNGGTDLDEALASLAAQTFTDFEVVAVDDHSTDGTPTRLRQAARGDSRLRTMSSPERGFVAAVNAGIAASRGKWIARMDADDRSHPDRLARQMAHLRAHPDLDVLGTSVQVIDADGSPAGTIRYPMEHALILLSLRAATAFAHGTVIMRSTSFAAAGGYRSVSFPVEDYDLWCRLALGGARLGNLDEPLYDYRLSRGGVSRTSSDRQAEMATAVGAEYGRLISRVPPLHEAWRAVEAIAREVDEGRADVRALARAARSTRESVVPWLQGRRWAAAASALGGAVRAEASYRRHTLTRRKR